MNFRYLRSQIFFKLKFFVVLFYHTHHHLKNLTICLQRITRFQAISRGQARCPSLLKDAADRVARTRRGNSILLKIYGKFSNVSPVTEFWRDAGALRCYLKGMTWQRVYASEIILGITNYDQKIKKFKIKNTAETLFYLIFFYLYIYSMVLKGSIFLN